MLVTILSLAPTIECPHSVNSLGRCSECFTAMNCIVLFLNWVLCGQSLQSVLVYNFTNMYAMSHRSDYFACSCRVNTEEHAICFTVSLLSAVSQVGSPSIPILSAISDWKSLYCTLLKVRISSKNERDFICDLSDLTLEFNFDAWCTSMTEGSKRPNAWNSSRHTPSWRFYLDCGIEETSSPGTICIICDQVLRHRWEHGTSSMGKHLLVKAHIGKLNELTEIEVIKLTSPTVVETTLAILKRQGSRVITIVSL